MNIDTSIFDELDVLAEKAGGYVDSCPDPNIRFGFDSHGFENYCREQGKDALDLTVRERNLFVFERKTSELKLDLLPDTGISYNYRDMSKYSREKGVEPIDLTIRETQQFINDEEAPPNAL